MVVRDLCGLALEKGKNEAAVGSHVAEVTELEEATRCVLINVRLRAVGWTSDSRYRSEALVRKLGTHGLDGTSQTVKRTNLGHDRGSKKEKRGEQTRHSNTGCRPLRAYRAGLLVLGLALTARPTW